ncbi:MAG: hypothetical protein F4X02_06270 [Chloroflexi bacterium]|nr:hypothetical protein [Chloroflexota bacterium]
MTVSAIILILTLFIASLAGHNQREDPSTQRALPWIDTLALIRADDGQRLRVNGRHAENCGAPWQTRVHAFPHNLDVQLYREVATAADCSPQDAPFEIELDLDSALDERAVIINDQVWGASRADFVKLSLFPAWIEQATLLPDANGGPRLRLQGSQAVGCTLPLLFTWRETGGGLSLGVYNAMDAAGVCPAVLVDIDETIVLPATELPADTLLEVNGILVNELETQNVSDTDKVLTNIFQVDATVAGDRVSLAVAGEHPDGCDYPVRVAQSRDGNRVQVEVYREIPADVFCPMILQPYNGVIEIEGAFAAGDYAIQVNSHSQTVNIPGA